MDRKLNVLIEKRNSEVFLRPRFTIDLDKNYKDILERFSDEFKKGNSKITGNIVDGHVFIKVCEKDEHFWSPQLHLEIIEKTVDTSLLKGLFGPKPAVWTLFMFIHFIIGLSFLAFCMMLYTRFSLSESLFFPLLMMIVLPLIWALLYFLGKIGKNTGKYQMRNLHDFMLQVLDD
ncbi:GTP-binding protein [Polaribacter sp. Asnod6-C07]|uniref:GTP-binding protein n=1 Tax=Polaribacter sp. Asnod6-C07 TaxID=3160582 RepID=UPI00386E0DF7